MPAATSASRKRSRDNQPMPLQSSRAFNVLSRFEGDDDDDDIVNLPSDSDVADEDSFNARSRRAAKPSSGKQQKVAASSQSKSRAPSTSKGAAASRPRNGSSRRGEELDQDDDMASLADTADGASDADDYDDTLQGARVAATTRSSTRSRQPNGKAALSSSSKSRARAEPTVELAEEDQDEHTLTGITTAAVDNFLLERKDYDEWMEKKLAKMVSKRERALEDKLQRMSSERDEIQKQFDELRQLRKTKPEEALDEIKKAAETRHKRDKELISSLKARAEAAERRARDTEANGGASADRSMSLVGHARAGSVQTSPKADVAELEKRHRREMADAVKVQRRLEEDVNRYKAQLEEEIATSKALLEKAHLGNNGVGASSSTKTSKAASSSSKQTDAVLTQQEHEDEKAIRKLYEDLTGLVITGVEMIDPKEKFRRFKALFAHDDYHSLVFALEESESVVETDPPSSTSTTRSASRVTKRDDIVYQPQLDDDRDRAFLDAQVTDIWYNTLRFERGMAFRFFNRLKGVLNLATWLDKVDPPT